MNDMQLEPRTDNELLKEILFELRVIHQQLSAIAAMGEIDKNVREMKFEVCGMHELGEKGMRELLARIAG